MTFKSIAAVTELKLDAIQFLTEYMSVHLYIYIGFVYITDTEILFLHKIMF